MIDEAEDYYLACLIHQPEICAGEVGSRAWIDNGAGGPEVVGNETAPAPGRGRFLGTAAHGLLVEN